MRRRGAEEREGKDRSVSVSLSSVCQWKMQLTILKNKYYLSFIILTRASGQACSRPESAEHHTCSLGLSCSADKTSSRAGWLQGCSQLTAQEIAS